MSAVILWRLFSPKRGHGNFVDLRANCWALGSLTFMIREEEACEMFTNTEMLSYIYRALGTKVGRRVQIDQPLSFSRR